MNTRSRSRLTIIAVLAVFAGLVLPACAKNSEAQFLAELVNKTRQDAGLKPLFFDDRLVDKAQAWADELASSGQVRHSVLRQNVGSGWVRLGENVGMASSVEQSHDLTMGSASHRAAVLNRNYTHFGTGVTVINGRYFFVEVFGA